MSRCKTSIAEEAKSAHGGSIHRIDTPKDRHRFLAVSWRSLMSGGKSTHSASLETRPCWNRCDVVEHRFLDPRTDEFATAAGHEWAVVTNDLSIDGVLQFRRMPEQPASDQVLAPLAQIVADQFDRVDRERAPFEFDDTFRDDGGEAARV